MSRYQVINGSLVPIGGVIPIDNIPTFKGSTNSAHGEKGLVPVPLEEDKNKALTGDGEWTDVAKSEMIAQVESSSTASNAYAIGEQFVLDGVLYIATSAIAIGDTFEVGTNCAINENITTQIKNIVDSYVTGIKGNAESDFRTGNVNITLANIAADPLAVENGGTGLTAAPNGKVDLSSNSRVSLFQASPTFGVENTLAVGNGGTGAATHTANAILAGDGTNAIKNIATAKGAFYATAANGAATFGTLPVEEGGTGATTAQNARANLGLGTAGQNFRITNPSSSGQALHLNWTDKNANSTLNGKNLIFLINDAGVSVWNGTDSKTEWSLNYPVAISQGGTGATSRLGAAKALTNENVADSATHLVSFTTSWGKFGYSTLQQIRKQMGLGNTTGAVPIANGGTGCTASTSFLTVTSHSTTKTIAAGAAVYPSWSITKSGYYPLGVVGFELTNGSSGNNADRLHPYSVRLKDQTTGSATLYFCAFNGSSVSATNITMQAWVLWMKV